ncbi:hypothetical protein H7I77_09955 [Mycolicibacterium novocastrense]|uniref:Uncharacterized protein n=1 Tax=Mycolicibacterium novocastrense TaxID=59813 RepID=A0AAW5SHG7_MYCNV|nr:MULTISPECIES: hypothetical protein [Mycolicibacterium]MCV7023669.1 hypothetical protein [Mycolicibacterium novocastrense]MDX1886906.1 hypothetical protein [Mycolicibacterium sp. 120270]GAT07685.1 putative uncharacterized protein [Mycolicibacterium novocastrense]
MTGSIIGIVTAVIVVVFLAKLALRRAGRTKVVFNVTFPSFPPPQAIPPYVPPAQIMPPYSPQGAIPLEANDEPARSEAQVFDDIVRDFYRR